LLSDHERRTLREIELALAAQDPGWAERFGGRFAAVRTAPRLPARVVWPVLLLVVGGLGLVAAVLLMSAPAILFALLLLLGGGVWLTLRRPRPGETG
jgi:hypothetical protein